MLVHNADSNSRFCPGLHETLDAFETREVDSVDCPNCRCVLMVDAPKKGRASASDDK